MRKKTASWLLTIIMVFSMLAVAPITAFAEGELQVTGGESGTDYTYEDGLLTILTGTPLTLSGSTVTDSVYVAPDIDANITLDNVSIELSAANTCAFAIADDSTGDVSITLVGSNLLQSGENRAGLQKKGTGEGVGTLTIVGEGSLTATGGENSAGIGGIYNGSSSNITINGGIVKAVGGVFGAGIGGGKYGGSGDIAITGGIVMATGGENGAGIGGGYSNIGADNNVSVSGNAVVFAKGHFSSSAKDIGNGSMGESSNNSLSVSDTAAVFLYNGNGPSSVTCDDGHALTDSFSYSPSFCGISLPAEWSDATQFEAYLRLVELDYNANFGDGTVPTPQTQHIGTTGTIQAGSGLSRTGYSFDGWITEGDEGYIFYDPGDSFTFEEDTTLYARWAIDPALYVGSDNVADIDGDVHYWMLSDDSTTETGTSDDYDFSVRYTEESEDPEFILTLNGLDLTSYLIFDDASKIGVYSNIPLTIVLAEGSENSITLSVEAGYQTYGVYADGDLTVTGSGSLDVTMLAEVSEEGYSADGFNADNVNITGGDIAVTVSGGEYTRGIRASDNMAVSGGEITVQTINALMEAIAIQARGDLVITGGGITCEATSGGYAAGIHAGDDRSEEGGVIITGGTVAAEATGGSTSIGIAGYSGVNISGGGVSSVATMPEPSDGDFGAIAICSESGNLTITGGEITASAEGGGNFTLGLLSFNDSVSISGGTVTASARNTANAGGIGSTGNITINGGVVNAAAISDEEGTASGLVAVNVYFEMGSVTASASANGEHPFSTAVAINVREDGDVTITAEDYRYRMESDGEYLIYPETPYVHNLSPYTEIATLYPVYYQYNYSEGGVFETKQVAYGNYVAEPESTPERENYNFVGWYKSSACAPIDAVNFDTYTITGAVTLYAGWAAIEYDISYNLAGGAVSGNPESYNVESSSITLNNPTRNGYAFAGWTGTGLSEPTMAVTIDSGSSGNREYTATWTQIPVDNGGSDTGGDTGGGGGSHATTSNTTDVTAEVKADGVSGSALPVTVDTDNRTASVDISSEGITQDRTTITIPSIPEVDTYTVGIPVPVLSTAAEQGSLTLDTDAGSVTVPSNMLTGVAGTSGSKAGISIGQGDKNTLPGDIKSAIGDRPLVQLTLSIDGKQTDWSNPSAPVTVSIPYTPTAAELANPESIVVWYIDGSGNVVTIPNGRYDAATGTVTFSTTHFSDYAVAFNKVSFNDVAAGSWYSKAVSFIAAREITSGTGDGTTYSPEAKLTRGEFIVLLMRAYGIGADTNPTDNFADAGNTYYTGYLAAAKRLGITAGVGNNMFAPGKEITRQEMFTLLYNSLKVIGQLPQGDSGKTVSDFSDAKQISSWAQEAMTLLINTGTVGGSGGKLTPTGTTTRAEMAQVLYNLLGK